MIKGIIKLKIKTRELTDTSWLAQIIADKMHVEFNKNRNSILYNCLTVLHIIINEADDINNKNIFYDNVDNKRQIIIRDIPSLIKYGTDFDREGMQAKLRGLAERYKDDDGMYIVTVATTHDLNYAIIKDITELLHQMSKDSI